MFIQLIHAWAAVLVVGAWSVLNTRIDVSQVEAEIKWMHAHFVCMQRPVTVVVRPSDLH